MNENENNCNKQYSELDKWAEVHGDFTVIIEFLEHLEQKGIILAQYYDYDDSHLLYPSNKNHRKLLEEYFEIDATKLEQERRSLLKEAQQANERSENE